LAGWAASQLGPHAGLPLLYLWGSAAAVGAAYHHWHREVYAADDIGHFTTEVPRPIVLRGVLDTEPMIVWQPKDDPLRTFPRSEPRRAALAVTQLRQRDNWRTVSGRAQLIVAGHLNGLHVGDKVEVVGRLSAPQGPANPGEFDYESYLRDQRIRAVVS